VHLSSYLSLYIAPPPPSSGASVLEVRGKAVYPLTHIHTYIYIYIYTERDSWMLVPEKCIYLPIYLPISISSPPPLSGAFVWEVVSRVNPWCLRSAFIFLSIYLYIFSLRCFCLRSARWSSATSVWREYIYIHTYISRAIVDAGAWEVHRSPYLSI